MKKCLFMAFWRMGSVCPGLCSRGGHLGGGLPSGRRSPSRCQGARFWDPPPRVPDAGNDPSLLHPQALPLGGVTPAAPPVAPSPPSCPSAGFLAASPAPGAVTSPGFVAFPGPLLCHCSCSIHRVLVPSYPSACSTWGPSAPVFPVLAYPSACSTLGPGVPLFPVPAASLVPVLCYPRACSTLGSWCSVIPAALLSQCLQHPWVPVPHHPQYLLIPVLAASMDPDAPLSLVPFYPEVCSTLGSWRSVIPSALLSRCL